MRQDLKRNFGLDCLRSLAITFVVISHATFLLFPNHSLVILDFIRTLGAIGVDLFFVLSGYLIGGIILKVIKEERLRWTHLFNFWKRRWLRTLPNYFLILVLNILLALLIGVDLPKNMANYFLFLQNFNNPHPNFFTEAWSLSIEEYAYLILPFLIFVCVILKPNADRAKLFLAATLLSIVLLSVFKLNYYSNTNVQNYKDWSASFRKIVIYRMDSIYLGFLLVYVLKKYVEFFKKTRLVTLLIGVFIFGTIHLLMYKFHLKPQTSLVFYTFIYLPLIVISLAFTFPYFLHIQYMGRLKGIVEFVSKRSYAIYLINYSLVLLTMQKFIDVSVLSISEKIILVLFYLIITLMLSHFLYTYFEWPILKWRDRKFTR